MGCFDGLDDWVGFHHHPSAAAIGSVVGDVMLVVRTVADVANPDVNQAGSGGARQDALGKRALEHTRKQCQYDELHSIKPLAVSSVMSSSITALPALLQFRSDTAGEASLSKAAAQASRKMDAKRNPAERELSNHPKAENEIAFQ